MNKPKRKFILDGKQNPSEHPQPIDLKLVRTDEKGNYQKYDPARFYTIDTIIELIDHIKSM